MFAAENDGDPAFQDIAEFLAFVGDVFRRGSAFRKLYEDRFQHIFLSVGNQPFPEHALRIFLEKFVFRKHHFFVRLFAEKFRKIASQSGKNVGEGLNRGTV